jgi:phosphoglucomutase
MPEDYPSAEKNRSGLDLTIFVKRMDYGRSSVSATKPHTTIFPLTTPHTNVAWLNIIAAANAKSPNKLIGINDLLQSHYEIYGRSFFSRYDYEEVSSEGANALVAHLNAALSSGSLTNTTHTSASTSNKFTVAGLYNFEYTDPIDHSVSSNQGQVITFSDGSRVVFRLSGTGSQGATVRMYVERYVPPEAGPAELGRDTADGLKGLIEVALQLSKLKEFLGRDKPTVITVSFYALGRGV